MFYPPATKRNGFLAYYSSRYPALEAVGTWRQMPSEATVARWIVETPDEFKVCPKMHADVTHAARLKPSGWSALDAFVQALIPLGRAGKQGPTLVQLPPNLKRDDALLREFLMALPQTETARVAVEFRHPSWQSPEVEALLADRNVAWVAAEDDDIQATFRDTSDHVYVRLRKLRYSDDELNAWAERLQDLAGRGKSVYAFVRHRDVEAPWRDADRLMELLTPSKS